MKRDKRIKFRLFFNVFRFMNDDDYYNEVADYYYWLYRNIKNRLEKSKIYWFLMEEQIIEDEY